MFLGDDAKQSANASEGKTSSSLPPPAPDVEAASSMEPPTEEAAGKSCSSQNCRSQSWNWLLQHEPTHCASFHTLRHC